MWNYNFPKFLLKNTNFWCKIVPYDFPPKIRFLYNSYLNEFLKKLRIFRYKIIIILNAGFWRVVSLLVPLLTLQPIIYGGNEWKFLTLKKKFWKFVNFSFRLFKFHSPHIFSVTNSWPDIMTSAKLINQPVNSKHELS